MSTKVYEGYRFPVERIHDFIREVRAKTIEIMAEHIRPSVNNARERYRSFLKPDQDLTVLRELSMESGWVFYYHKGYIYTYPYGLLSGSVGVEQPLTKHVQLLGWVQPFHYWNNTDPDEDVSEQEWQQRGEIWDDIFSKPGRSMFHVTTFHLWEVSAVEVEFLQDGIKGLT